MASKKVPKQIIPLLRGAVNAFFLNPIILLPFITIAFIQLLVLEILYFSHHFPLSSFFDPIIATLWGVEFIHYPKSILILPKLFQNIQVLIYIFISSYFISVAIGIISTLNSGKKVNFNLECKERLGQYVHIFTAALIAFCAFFGIYKLYYFLLKTILETSSINSLFFIVKKIVVNGAPYASLLIGIFVTALFAFVLPIIVIDKKKIISAIGLNFKNLWGSFWYVLIIVMIPTLFYLPILLIRSNISAIASVTFPEIRVLALVVSIIVTMFIDLTIYTAITSYYLLKKEHS